MEVENTITLVTVCDNHFAVLLAALLKSIEVNHRSPEPIHLYIVDDNISAANKNRLQKSITNEAISMFWVSMNEAVPPRVQLPLDNSSFPLNTYIRLCIPHFIPQEVKKVIYLDVDMIVLEDISRLWHQDLGGKVIAGVVDRSEVVSSPWGGIKNYQELGLPPDTKYFNAGLLLIDAERWRSENITSLVFQCIKENQKSATFPDQYGLNVVFANQWQELDSRWNCIPMRNEAHPFIIHFIGRKPIFKGYNYNEDYKKMFFDYLKQTDWKNYKQKPELSRLVKKFYNVIVKKLLHLTEKPVVV